MLDTNDQFLALNIVAALAIAYLIGSIPFGLLIGRLHGIDIRSVGSRNIGATNVMRTIGPRWGILTLGLDILKGWLVVAVMPAIVARAHAPGVPAWLALACGAAVIAGHNWPVYLGFKGGKGVAASAGVLMGIAPMALLFGLLVFAVVFGLSRYVSLGSIAAATAIPAAAWIGSGENDSLTPVTLTAIGLLIVWRHESNIRRLINGTENRVRFRARPE